MKDGGLELDIVQLQEGQPQNGPGHYAQVIYLINKYDQSNSADVVQPHLDYSLLYPSGSPLANGVFVRPACGKDDKTIAENDYG